ncbi:hypothetical protein BS17DRAFT_829558, partial [Gyrodon lividus]
MIKTGVISLEGNLRSHWSLVRWTSAHASCATLTGLTIAEYVRVEEGQDVLLFIINIFQFTQASSEISALLGCIPSAVGYQPTLSTDMGGM